MSRAEGLSCFVISPIGDAEDTPSRHAEAAAVMELIIKPAERLINQQRLGLPLLRTVRGDEIFQPGGIRRQVVESIVHDDVLVAVMFENNVNVFYELGIAETLGRPVILLSKRGYAIPFDIGGDRRVEYPQGELRPGLAVDRTVATLAEHMTNLLSAEDRFKPPFDLNIMAPPARTLAYDRFNELSHLQWSKLLLAADREIWLAGTSLWPSLFDPNFEGFCQPRLTADGVASFEEGTIPCNVIDILEILYRLGREINILTMDDRSDLLATMLCVPSGRTGALEAQLHEVGEQIRKTHRTIKATLERLAREHADDPGTEQCGVFRLAKVGGRILTSRVTLTEKRGYVTPIFYSLGLNSGPSFHVAPKSREELKKAARNDSHQQICLFSQIHKDLCMHMAESEPVALVRGRLVEGSEAARVRR